ncbi:hypothetical protein BU15DRAFT_79770 [Melanogaster broomeanus]|nr:hypothetical protein BU15DRAFT_79770 [Melanogaster broomeanus]
MDNPQANTLAQLYEDLEHLAVGFTGWSSESASSAAPTAALTCNWVTEHGFCGSILTHDPKVVSAHLRDHHGLKGREKEVINCRWNGCHSVQMQRGSLVRHVLSVHLRILQWTCPICAKTFSRKDTGHPCVSS